LEKDEPFSRAVELAGSDALPPLGGLHHRIYPDLIFHRHTPRSLTSVRYCKELRYRSRGLQVGSFKALAKAIVHRLQKPASLGYPALIMLASEPGLWMLAAPMRARPVVAPNRASAKKHCSAAAACGAPSRRNEFAFDAQKLGDAPALLIGVRSRKRLVDYREPFGSLAVTTDGRPLKRRALECKKE